MPRPIEARVADATFVLQEAMDNTQAVTDRCGAKEYTLVTWEEYFALTNAMREAVRLLDPTSAFNR